MPEEKKSLRGFNQQRFQEEVARELGIDLNVDDATRPGAKNLRQDEALPEDGTETTE